MGQAKLAWKVYKFKKGMDEVAQAKIDAMREREGLPPLRPWWKDCIINTWTWSRETCFRACCPCCIYDRNRHLRRKQESASCFGRLLIDGTHENDMCKSFIAFWGGIFIAFMLFIFMLYHMQYSTSFATPAAIILGLIFGIGMAMSLKVRCVVLLMLPQVFSSKGRAVLLTYCFLLVMNGPVRNFTHNIQVMSESATCGQILAYNATQKIMEEAMAPMKGVIGTIRGILDTFSRMAEQLRQAFQAIQDIFKEIGNGIKEVFSWLGDMVDVCNENMGAPYRKCLKAFDTALVDCKEEMGVTSPVMCSPVKAFRPVCNVARIGELLCLIASAIKRLVVDKVKTGIKTAVHNVYEMFYFNVTLIYHYNYTIEQSKSNDEIRADIMNEINERLSPLKTFISISNTGIIFMLGWMLIKALIYRRKYITKDKFDNYYTSFIMQDIDERRAELEKETVLPLSFGESGKYISTFSPRLAKSEKSKMVRGLVMLCGSFLHSSFYMYCDLGLWWLLNMIRKHAELKTHNEIPPHLRMHVQGNGVLADMYRNVIEKLEPMGKYKNLEVDTTRCLPNPSVPDINIYRQILIIWGICIFLVLTEAYGLRLRHIIMGCYHPQREKERAIWLYNHILRKRGGFLKFMMNQTRRKQMMQDHIEKITIRDRLSAKFPLCQKIFHKFGYDRKYCIVCGQPGKPDDMSFKHCDNYDCEAIYCNDCFIDANNMCNLCMRPIDYGEMSDFSEERDSSDMSQKDVSKDADAETDDEDDSDLDYDYQYDTSDEEVADDESDAYDADDDLYYTPKRKHTSRPDLVSMQVFEYDEDEDEGDENKDAKYVEGPPSFEMQRGEESSALTSAFSQALPQQAQDYNYYQQPPVVDQAFQPYIQPGQYGQSLPQTFQQPNQYLQTDQYHQAVEQYAGSQFSEQYTQSPAQYSPDQFTQSFLPNALPQTQLSVAGMELHGQHAPLVFQPTSGQHNESPGHYAQPTGLQPLDQTAHSPYRQTTQPSNENSQQITNQSDQFAHYSMQYTQPGDFSPSGYYEQ